jgi:signal transduction histidine kinase
MKLHDPALPAPQTQPAEAIEQLTFLYRAARALSSSLNTQKVLQMLMRLAHQYLQPDAVSIALVKPDGALVFEAASGKSAQQTLGLRLQPGMGVAGWVAQHGEPLWVPQVHDDARHYRGADEETGFRTYAIYAMPIKMGDQTLAVLELVNPGSDIHQEETKRVLLALVSLAAPAIHNANLFEQVQRAEKRYQQLFESNLDPIVILDQEGQMLHHNQAIQQILDPSTISVGQSCLEALGMSQERFTAIKTRLQETNIVTWEMEIAMHTHIAPEIQSDRVHSTTAEANESRIFEIRMTYLADYISGDYASGDSSRNNAVDKSGHSEGVYQWLAHDITDRVELDRLRKEWASMLVHDLRAPLNIILNSLELVYSAWKEKDTTIPFERIFGITQRNIERLEQLIDNILDMEKIEVGERLLYTADIDIPTLIQEVQEVITPLVASRTQTVHYEVPEGLPPMTGEVDMLRRVLINLLENAAKFTPRGGGIILSVDVDEDNFHFSVADTGRGIHVEDTAHVFELFYRGKGQEKKTKGTGIGLAFCKKAVEAHGGKIWVESRPGEGSTFIFTIPRR